MNRSLRSSFNQHLRRACASLALLLFAIFSYGQIENCPSGFVNITVDNDVNCTANFASSPVITAINATFTSSGATTLVAPTDFNTLDQYPFEYGVSEVTIVSVSAQENCVFTVVTSADEVPFLELCDDVTVDLEGACNLDYNLPLSYTQASTVTCEGGEISFSFSDADATSTSLSLDAEDIGILNLQVFIAKGNDRGSCSKQITVVDSDPIVSGIGCLSSTTVQVAPSCQYVYSYSILDTIPCGGMLEQAAGGPSGTALSLGENLFAFQIRTAANTLEAACSWTVTVEQSNEVGAQMNCIAKVNISLDQTCEAVVDPLTFVTGGICADISALSVSATLPTGEEMIGSEVIFTQEHVGMEIDVTVADPNGINSCWGTLTIEDKLAPIISCPTDVIVTCLESIDTSETGLPILLGGITTDDIAMQLQSAGTLSNRSCEVDLFYGDLIEDFQCDGDFQRVVSRTFYVIDNAGNRSENCTQQIFITRETLASTVFPMHFDGAQGEHTGIEDNGVASNPALACDGQDIAWASIVTEGGKIIPSPFDSITPAGVTIPGTGAPSGIGTCGTIFSYYEDIVIEACNNGCVSYNPSFKVLRKWDIFDWCTGDMRIHEQVIKVIDTVPPTFTVGVPDMTISTDLWGCGATIDLPEVLAIDQCATDITYSWTVTNGTYDAVLNKVYVRDNALTEIGGEIALIATAEDCCGNMARDTGYVTIIDAIVPVVVADEETVVSLNNQQDDGSTKVHVDSFDDGSWDNCGPIEWWVRRMDNACEGYDGLDSLGNIDSTEVDEINDFQKYLHFCCEDVDSIQRVVFMVCDDGDGDGVVEMNGEDNCTTAMILVDVQDKLAPTVVCPDPTTINCIDFAIYEDFIGAELTDNQVDLLNIRFGEAYATSTCVILGGQAIDGDELCGIGTITRTFTVSNSNGDASCNQVISVEADMANVLTCDRISFPTLSLAPNHYNWCDPTDAVAPFVTPVTVQGCGEVVIEEPVIDRDNLCTEVGATVTLDTFNFANGGCIKILAHWEVIDKCIFKENYFDDKGDSNPNNDEVNPFVAENGYYELYVEYDIFDTDQPILECEDLTVETAGCEYNFDSFSIKASDECTPADALTYTYKIDYNSDGRYDYPADSTFAEGSVFDANVVGGLPVGKHNIKWVVSDGCGNYGVCLQEIEVVQRIKAPTPYCYLGISSAVMDSIYGCSVETWALDFVPDAGLGACGEELTYLMIPYQDIYGDPADPADDLSYDEARDKAEANWVFGCDYIENGVQHVIEIRIYAIDENGVYDFCDASLTLNDNFDCCSDAEIGSTLIAGNIMTESGVVMKDVEIKIEGTDPELPKSLFSTANGKFMFNGLDFQENYRVSAHYDKNPLQGVSTLDLVFIQRHILGMTELDSPYKLIAADISGNESISAIDLLQLRKLILGLYTDDKLPGNKSWRFLDDSYKFVDASQPFPFNEVIHIKDLPHALYNTNFVAVKVGDVNNSFQASQKGDATVRTNKVYDFIVDDRSFEKGGKVEVPVTVADLKDIYGFQFTLDYNSNVLHNVEIASGSLEIEEGNFAIVDDRLRVSWNQATVASLGTDDVIFTITFDAMSDGRLSDAIKLSENDLKAEIYDGNFATDDLAIGFRSLEEGNFTLQQNEPNPFNANTRIKFELPEPGLVQFKVFDITGRILMNETTKYTKGANSIIVNAADFNVSGVLYYQIEFNSQQLTKKMILID